jgi:hypothetical protein
MQAVMQAAEKARNAGNSLWGLVTLVFIAASSLSKSAIQASIGIFIY